MTAQQRNDTIFLQKNGNNSIYIDPSKNSNTYNYFFEEFKNLQKGSLSLKLPSKWIPLYKYQKKYYIYKSCDCYNPIIKITDEKTSLKCFEESEYKNIKISTNKDKSIEISYTNFSQQKEKLRITYLDKEKGIAIFEFINSKKQSNYLLMVDLDKIKSLPIVVNDCKTSKTKEFVFDKINFKRLQLSKK